MNWLKALAAGVATPLIFVVVRYGWRSLLDAALWMLAALKTRGEDDTPDDVDEHLETEPDDVKPWKRVQPLDSRWHPGRACLGPGCTHDNNAAADLLLWEDELAAEPGIRKYTRRMDR